MVLTEKTKEEIYIIFMTGYIPEANSSEICCISFFFSFKHLLNAFFIGNVLRVNAEILAMLISLHGLLWL